MDANFQVETDPSDNLLRVRLFGFLAIEDVEALRQRIRTALASLSCAKGHHIAVYDVRECKIQTQEVVARLRSMSDAKGVAARRIAVIVGDSLMKMQLPRIVVDRDVRTFDAMGPAITWLKSEPGAENAHRANVKKRVQRPPTVPSMTTLEDKSLTGQGSIFTR